ncbi:reverse transcriptase domain-containing protein [Tanacetum coccineum]
MPIAYHMFTYTFKVSARIWWNSQKAGIIFNYEDLKAKFRSHFSQQKKFTKTHLAVHNIKQKEGKSTRAFISRYTDDTLQILGLHEDQRMSGFVHGLRTRNLVEFLSTDLPTTYKGLMKKTYPCIEVKEVATNRTPTDQREGFEKSRKNPSWDNNKGQKNKDTFFSYRGSNHELLSNLSKSPREILATEKVAKTFEQPPRLTGSRRSWDMSKYCHFHKDHRHNTNQCRELRHQIEEPVKSGQLAHLVKGIKKGKDKASDTQLALKRKSVEEFVGGVGEITFLPISSINSSDPVIIKAQMSRRRVNRPLGEVPLEITIGDSPYARTEILNFVIVRSNSPHNLLLGRTAMQRMGIVVSTIHGAIKIHTPRGIGTVFSTRESDKAREEQKKLKGTPKKILKGILSCVDDKERIVVNKEYPEQTIIIGRQLPTSFKMKLQDLLRANVDVFAWTYAHMMGNPKTIMVGGEPFNTEHRLNEFKHIESIKQKKRILAPERNKTMRKKVKELTKANILREVKYQTWMSNPIMVKKDDGRWKLCVDFTDINKACPKDHHPLPAIDQKVEILSMFQLKCFLDVYKGYHQIQMEEITRKRQPSTQEKECSAIKDYLLV